MDQSGALLAVSLSCDINTGTNQSDCTNCLKSLRIAYQSILSNPPVVFNTASLSMLSIPLIAVTTILYDSPDARLPRTPPVDVPNTVISLSAVSMF